MYLADQWGQGCFRKHDLNKKFRRRQYTCTCTLHSTCPECNKIRGSVCQACVPHLSFCFEETKYGTFKFHGCFIPNFGSFGYSVSEKKIFQKSTNQKQEQPVAAMYINGWGPSTDVSYQNSVHLDKWFQRRRFLEIDQPETRIAYGGHVC